MTVKTALPSRCAAPLPEKFRLSPQTMSWEAILKRLLMDLPSFGLDIVAPFSVQRYNAVVQDMPASSIPETGSNTFAVMVGNTKNIWAPFIEACKYFADLPNSNDPLDTYIERSVEACASTLGRPYRCFWGHEKMPQEGGEYLALQRLAHTVGLAYLDEDSHLCIHPKYGPWFSLRAVLVFDGVEYLGPCPSQLADPLSPQTRQYIKFLIKSACTPSTDNLATLAEERSQKLNMELVRRRWQKWVAVRDAPFPGHPWKFSHLQLEYHYTGDRGILHRLAADPPAPAPACSPPQSCPPRRASTSAV